MHGRAWSVRAALPVVTFTVLLAGCSGAAGKPNARPRASKSPTTAVEPTALQVKDSVLKSPDGETRWLTTWGHYVGWAGAPRKHQPADHVTLFDIATGTARHVATAARGEEVLWVRGDDETVAYLTVRVQDPRQRQDALDDPPP
jgi:hypothetical protein